MSPPATTNSGTRLGIAWRVASPTMCSIRLLKKTSVPTSNAPVRAWIYEGRVDFAVGACYLNLEARNKPERHGIGANGQHDCRPGGNLTGFKRVLRRIRGQRTRAIARVGTQRRDDRLS